MEIKLEINFADTISYSDYIKAKNKFYNRQKHEDKYNQLGEEFIVISEGVKYIELSWLFHRINRLNNDFLIYLY